MGSGIETLESAMYVSKGAEKHAIVIGQADELLCIFNAWLIGGQEERRGGQEGRSEREPREAWSRRLFLIAW